MSNRDSVSASSWTWASSVARGLLLLALAACCVVNIGGVDGRGPVGQQSARSAAKVHNSPAGADHPSSSTSRLAASKVVDIETDLSESHFSSFVSYATTGG